MTKELEALNIIKFNPDDVDGLQYLEAFKVVEQALQRLEAIDNANPSEALECLDRCYDELCSESARDNEFNTIKQTLLKAQEQEKFKEDICKLFNLNLNDLPYTDNEYIIKVLQCIIDNVNKMQDKFIKVLEEKAEHEKVLEILKPLCEVVETPVKKLRYLKMNGVVVYTFKNEEEFDLLKRYCNEQNNK